MPISRIILSFLSISAAFKWGSMCPPILARFSYPSFIDRRRDAANAGRHSGCRSVSWTSRKLGRSSSDHELVSSSWPSNKGTEIS